jgi:hypothetical protein
MGHQAVSTQQAQAGRRERESGAATTSGRPASTAAAAHRREIVEHETGVAIATIDEIDFDTTQMLKRAAVDDYFEPADIEDAVVVVDTVGEGHSKADAAASAWRSKHADALDAVVYLGEQLTHFVLRRGSQGEISLSESSQHLPISEKS